MNNSKSTQGPMTVGFDGPSRPIILAPNNVMLSISKFEDGRWTSYDEEDADCRLFAVATELLEALEELHDLVEENMIGAYKFDSFTLQAARLAIAKARGQ